MKCGVLRNHSRLAVSSVLLFALCSAIIVTAQTTKSFYVAKDGDDSNPCTLNLPCVTFNWVLVPWPALDMPSLFAAVPTSIRVFFWTVSGCACKNGTNWTEGSGAITWKAYPAKRYGLGMFMPTGSSVFDWINTHGTQWRDSALTMNAPYVLYKNAEIKNAWQDGISSHAFSEGAQSYNYTIRLKVHNNGNSRHIQVRIRRTATTTVATTTWWSFANSITMSKHRILTGCRYTTMPSPHIPITTLSETIFSAITPKGFKLAAAVFQISFTTT